MPSRYQIHHEPDPPSLWVIYQEGKRVGQAESEDGAYQFVHARGGEVQEDDDA